MTLPPLRPIRTRINSRSTREHWVQDTSNLSSGEGREAFQRDRDRILYSSAFRRLAGITEIVRAGESDVFHTRQQHTLKVAQVGRRLTELLIKSQPEEAKFYDISPDVVEAACFAHDLGHPPFGHAGEEALCRLVEKNGDDEGYEGNAQTFRIVTKLSAHSDDFTGLNLTAATLAAILKYPWTRDSNDKKRKNKWSVYKTERRSFNFSQRHLEYKVKTVEAEIMDWADDIAYSVHDIEDFHRCQFIPWNLVWSVEGKKILLEGAKKIWFGCPIEPEATDRLTKAYESLKTTMERFYSGQYEGTLAQRREIRTINSGLISRLMLGFKLKSKEEYNSNNNGDGVEIIKEQGDMMRILKQITRSFILSNSTLAAQQKGQRRIIEELFQDLYDDSRDSKIPNYLPSRLKVFWTFSDATEASPARRVADCISSLTEAETIGLHARLRGLASGSVLDPIVR